MAARKVTRWPEPMRLSYTKGKGVLDKWGEEPFAPSTLHVTTKDGWHRAIDYTMANMVSSLFDPRVVEIHLIDHNNDEYVIKKEGP